MTDLQYCNQEEKFHWLSSDCKSFKPYVDSKIWYIENIKAFVVDYLKAETSRRKKRGVLDSIDDISKILFGTLTPSDAKEYNEHISRL